MKTAFIFCKNPCIIHFVDCLMYTIYCTCELQIVQSIETNSSIQNTEETNLVYIEYRGNRSVYRILRKQIQYIEYRGNRFIQNTEDTVLYIKQRIQFYIECRGYSSIQNTEDIVLYRIQRKQIYIENKGYMDLYIIQRIQFYIEYRGYHGYSYI